MLDRPSVDSRGGAEGPRSLGVCTWIFGHHDHAAIARRTAALGMDGVELLVDIDAQTPGQLRRVYSQFGLSLFSMTPANVDIAHSSRNERRAGVAYYERLIDFAAELACPRVTCHEAVGRTGAHDSPAREWNRLVESCRQIACRAGECGVRVVFEPLHRGLVSQVHTSADLMRLIRAVGHHAFRGLVDTFHMDLEEVDPAKGIRSLGASVDFVQLADRERQALGAGGASLRAGLNALDAINYTGPMVLECTSELRGPNLKPVHVNQERLEKTLRRSLNWLRPTQSEWLRGS